jgi:tetratricopeptide (TPR) repeat protein
LRSAEQACALAVKIGDRSAEAWAQTNLGHSYFASGEFPEAAKAYQNALEIRNKLDQPLLATEPAAGFARALLEQGDLETAYQHVQTILPILNEKKDLAGTDDPIRVYLTCYLVLNSKKESDAIRILEAAHDLIQSRAAKIPYEDTRKSFLENIPHHHEIMVAWQKHISETHQLEN